MSNKKEKLVEFVSNLKNNKINVFFVVPEIDAPNASINEIYFQASVLIENGFSVKMLIDSESGDHSSFVENKYQTIKHSPLGKSKLNVSPSDILVIPEVFTNIMEQTKDLPCIKIMLFQSIDYALNSLLIGSNWSLFNINNILTTSTYSKEFIEFFYGNNFNIKSYKIGIPEYFNRKTINKKPIVSFVSRNNNDISKIIKLFYTKYPQFSWVSFDPLLTKSETPTQLTRDEFANRLGENFAAIWIDRISTFGTFPIECLKSGVIPVIYSPDFNPEYITDDIFKDKYTVSSIYSIPDIIAGLLNDFVYGELDFDYKFDAMIDNYTVDESKNTVISAYNEFILERIKLLEDTIKNIDDEE